MEMSLREAMRLGHTFVGVEHLLLGLVRYGQGTAVRVLNDLGVEMSLIQTQVMQLLSSTSTGDVAEPRQRAQFGDAIFRGVVRAVGQQLRPDLDDDDLVHWATTIADDLFDQLRESWAEAEPSH
jgi:ATP-dependent Clp protease ATP-binding subunit ClpC